MDILTFMLASIIVVIGAFIAHRIEPGGGSVFLVGALTGIAGLSVVFLI